MRKNITLFTKLFFVFFVFCYSSCGLNSQDKSNSLPKVSVVFPVTIDSFDNLKKGLKESCGQKFELKYYSAEGDAAKFETTIQSALIEKPDYLITIGTQITNTAFGPKFTKQLPTVIAGAISSPELVDALVNIGLSTPRKSPVAIVSDSPKENIYELFTKTLKGVLPNAKTIGIIFNPSEVNSKGTSNKISLVLKQNGIKVNEGIINNSEDIEKVIESLLLNGVDAIIIPHDKNAVTKATSIVKMCDDKKIPVFSLDDGTVKKDGVSIGISVNYYNIGTLLGQTLLKIDSKQIKAEDMPIAEVKSAKIYVNINKLNELGLKLPKDLDSLIEKN